MLSIYEFYHGFQAILNNPRDNEMWLEALEAKFDGKGKPYGLEEWDKLLGHCQGISDVPAILFAMELIEAYPDAKVILTHGTLIRGIGEFLPASGILRCRHCMVADIEARAGPWPRLRTHQSPSRHLIDIHPRVVAPP